MLRYASTAVPVSFIIIAAVLIAVCAAVIDIEMRPPPESRTKCEHHYTYLDTCKGDDVLGVHIHLYMYIYIHMYKYICGCDIDRFGPGARGGNK